MTCDILHMDETRIQVNKEEGWALSTNSFMWVIQSGACEELNATYFFYSPTRKKDIKHNFCCSHCRRYFIESIPLDTKGKELPDSKGAKAMELIDTLFRIEKKIKNLSYEKKKEKRQVASRAALDAFWSWCEETRAIPTANEKLTKALNYALNHQNNLETFLEDGRLEISNNLCESHIRPFTTGRRSWLFADTPKGATANAVAFTLVESAKANNLNVYEYIKYLLEQMPNNDYCNNPDVIDTLLPWSKELPDICRLSYNMKKHM